MDVMRLLIPKFRTASLAAMLVLASCGSAQDQKRGGSGGSDGPITVGYVIVQRGSAPIQQDLPARVNAYQVSEVRPQVNGVILRRLASSVS